MKPLRQTHAEPGLPDPRSYLTDREKRRWREFASWPTVFHIHYPLFERVINLERYEVELHNMIRGITQSGKGSPNALAKVLLDTKKEITKIVSAFTGTPHAPAKDVPAPPKQLQGDGVDQLLAG